MKVVKEKRIDIGRVLQWMMSVWYCVYVVDSRLIASLLSMIATNHHKGERPLCYQHKREGASLLLREGQLYILVGMVSLHKS